MFGKYYLFKIGDGFMEIQLQELIDQIKKDGVGVAETEAEKIISSAKEEAEKIVAGATVSCATIII